MEMNPYIHASKYVHIYACMHAQVHVLLQIYIYSHETLHVQGPFIDPDALERAPEEYIQAGEPFVGGDGGGGGTVSLMLLVVAAVALGF
jgi:hypothetical protein